MKDIEYLAIALDSKFQGPFGFRFGWDGIIGLIPGFGNIITSALSFYIVLRGILLKLPASIVIRMCINIIIEILLGLLPIVGNIFDFVWKANLKNIELIKEFSDQPIEMKKSSKFLLYGILAAAASIAIGIFALTIFLVSKIFVSLLNLF